MSNLTDATVLICQPLLFQTHGPYREILEAAGLQLKFPRQGGRVMTEAELTAEIEGVSATIASTEPYTRQLLSRANSLRVISRTGVGYDSIDVVAATEKQIAVGVTPGTNHEAVAEHVFSLLLGLTKHVVANHSEIVRGGFKRIPSRTLRGRTLGIVGLGRIGRAVAVRARAFGMTVLAFDPYFTPDDASPDQPPLVSLHELLSQSDVVSLHAASTDATRRMIRRETLTLMKPGAILINTARGTLVDEQELAEALAAGHLGAAGLDVFDQEPPTGSPLVNAPNVLLSPHIAGVDEQSFEDMATMAARTIVDMFSGNFPGDRIVNAAALAPSWTWKLT